jgi:hypothetical protein
LDDDGRWSLDVAPHQRLLRSAMGSQSRFRLFAVVRP